MVVFVFMGAAAGILGAYRATGRIAYGMNAISRDTAEGRPRDAGEETSRDAGGATKGKQDADLSARNDRE